MKSLMKCQHTEGKKHDCRLVDLINMHVEASAKIADDEVPGRNDEEWNRVYFREMAFRTQHLRTFYGK